MTPEDDYEPQKDSHDSYYAAIEAKRRGDHLRDPRVDRRMKKLGAALEAEIERQEAKDGRA